MHDACKNVRPYIHFKQKDCESFQIALHNEVTTNLASLLSVASSCALSCKGNFHLSPQTSHGDHKLVHLTAHRLSLYYSDQNSGRYNKRSLMAKTLSLSEVKTRLPELVAGVQEREEEVIVTKNGRPAAILMNIDEYTRLKETLDVLSDPGLMSQIAESRAFYNTKRNGLSFEDVFGEPLVPIKKRRTA